VRVVEYAAEQVVTLDATFGYAVAVQFDPGERLETVSVGNSLDWQLLPNKRANVLFVKPLHAARPTNMTVVTDTRIYHFELRSRRTLGARDRAIIFALKFDYPARHSPPFPRAISNQKQAKRQSTKAMPAILTRAPTGSCHSRCSTTAWSPISASPTLPICRHLSPSIATGRK
jgi:type IV secretion system protein VirB9